MAIPFGVSLIDFLRAGGTLFEQLTLQVMPMAAVAKFVVELIRAANELERIGPFERERLLHRAVQTIRDMRDEIGIRSSRTAADAVIDLQTTAVALGSGKRSDAQVREALLQAAGMVRDLHIILDTKTEISVTGRRR